MGTNKDVAIAQIDSVLQRYEEVKKEYWHKSYSRYDSEVSECLKAPPDVDAELITLMKGVIDRLAPNGEKYVSTILKSDSDYSLINGLLGALRALRADYVQDRLKTFQELVRSDIFSDFLSMAEYLLNDEKLKDPAAVMAGGVLEEHIRQLCNKHGITTTFTDAKGDVRPKKLDVMNADLAKAGAYGANDQKQVTAWAGIRNSAAHAKPHEYTHEQVVSMVQGIRSFLSRNPV
jgi:hypothetical protein